MEQKQKEVRYVGVKENLLFGLANAGQCFSYGMFGVVNNTSGASSGEEYTYADSIFLKSQLCIVKGEGKEEAAYGIDKTLSGLLIGVIALLDSYTNSSQSYMLQINDRTDSWINRKK